MGNPQFMYDETFDYVPENFSSRKTSPVTVSWNLFGEDIDITHIEFDGNVWTGEELWELDDNLAENIMEYIDVKFVSNDDFWIDKVNPGL